MSSDDACSMVVRVACALAIGSLVGCTANVPGQFVASTGPIDASARINTVGKEAIGESCQWWISIGSGSTGLIWPLPMEGNQNHLAVKDALGDEYDGLINAVTDSRTTHYGIAFPTGADPDPRNWVRAFAISVCQEIRGTPYVYAEPLAGSK